MSVLLVEHAIMPRYMKYKVGYIFLCFFFVDCVFLFEINASENFSDIKLKGICCEGGRHLGADSNRGH